MTAKKLNNGLRVIVTGAGEGIGFACASAFAARGAELILTDHDPEALTEAAEFLGAFSRFCDVLSETSAAIFADGVEQDFGSFDVLVNAAGNGFVRTLGMMRMAKALLPLMRQGSGARLIVNVAPCFEPSPKHRLFPHGGSQTGFRQLSDALAAQTRGSSIGVVAVRPTPRPAPAGSRLECGHDELAESIVGLVRAQRPEWVPRRSRTPKRA
jgi:NAD(P)-dependent dehydrogenase (short-subunit alcohol dehydrogenase family)